MPVVVGWIVELAVLDVTEVIVPGKLNVYGVYPPLAPTKSVEVLPRTIVVGLMVHDTESGAETTVTFGHIAVTRCWGEPESVN